MRRTAVAVAAGLVVLSGCGIRATSVPVDSGPAPSRSQCLEPDDPPSPTPSAPAASPVDREHRLRAPQVFLVCNGQVAPVTRDSPLEGDYAMVTGLLLAQVKLTPNARESDLGYTTKVPADLEFLPARDADPAGTLRLNHAPDRLRPLALGQLVCTLSDGLWQGAPVPLAGPAPDAPVLRYACDAQIRTEPGSVANGDIPL